MGLANELCLGYLEARRDWGFAGDYVDALRRIIQSDHPEDFVVDTDETQSVQEFCDRSFSYLDLDYKEYIVHDPRFYRSAEVDLLVADSTRDRQTLGWAPKVDFDVLVRKIVDAELVRLGKEIS